MSEVLATTRPDTPPYQCRPLQGGLMQGRMRGAADIDGERAELASFAVHADKRRRFSRFGTHSNCCATRQQAWEKGRQWPDRRIRHGCGVVEATQPWPELVRKGTGAPQKRAGGGMAFRKGTCRNSRGHPALIQKSV